MKLLAVCRGQAGTVGGKNPHRSGIFKHPVSGPVMVDAEGIVGDKIVDRKHHGGPDQALLIEGGIDRAFWEAELGRPLSPGAFGENLLIEGLDHRGLSIGDRLSVGDVLLEITSCRMPCATFAAHLGLPDIVKRYTKALRPGPYVRVIRAGLVEAGQAVTHHPFAGERIPISEVMDKYGTVLSETDRARFLAAPIHFKLRARLDRGDEPLKL